MGSNDCLRLIPQIGGELNDNFFWGSNWSNRQNLWEKQGETPNLMVSYQILWVLLVLVLLGGAIW